MDTDTDSLTRVRERVSIAAWPCHAFPQVAIDTLLLSHFHATTLNADFGCLGASVCILLVQRLNLLAHFPNLGCSGLECLWID